MVARTVLNEYIDFLQYKIPCRTFIERDKAIENPSRK